MEGCALSHISLTLFYSGSRCEKPQELGDRRRQDRPICIPGKMDDESKAVKAAGLSRGRSSSVREVSAWQHPAPEDRASPLEGHARGESMATPENVEGTSPYRPAFSRFPGETRKVRQFTEILTMLECILFFF